MHKTTLYAYNYYAVCIYLLYMHINTTLYTNNYSVSIQLLLFIYRTTLYKEVDIWDKLPYDLVKTSNFKKLLH